MSIVNIKSVVIIPCFNEEKSIVDTCKSLGFGLKNLQQEQDIFLILVNNNSTDNTLKILNDIKANSIVDSVYVVNESKQGYIPARCAGIKFLESWAKEKAFKQSDILVFQADADTIYSTHYIYYIREAASQATNNILYDAIISYPPYFKAQYSCYLELCEKIDNIFMEEYIEQNSLDLIIDDKVSAYWYSDYLLWGEHQQEYTTTGDEIYAETTRLLIKATGRGAKRRLVEGAFAYHSARKILQDPLLHLATAGFPREKSWVQNWHNFSSDKFDMKKFEIEKESEEIVRAIEFRKRHLYALFKILPFHVSSILESSEVKNTNLLNQPFLEIMPKRSQKILLSSPSTFLMDALAITNFEHGYKKLNN